MDLAERLNDLYEQRQRLTEELDRAMEPTNIGTVMDISASPAEAITAMMTAKTDAMRRQFLLLREISWCERQIVALLSNPRL